MSNLLKNTSSHLFLFFILCSVSLFTSSIQYVDATPPTSYDADITISHPPKLGETAQVKLEIADIFDLHDNNDVLDYNAGIHLPEGFEVVDGTINKTATWKAGETFMVEATIKAIKPGNWSIYGSGLSVITGDINVVVSKDDSYFHQGHFKTPPNYATMIDPANITILSRSELSSISPPSSDAPDTPSVDFDLSKMQSMPPVVDYDYGILTDKIISSQQQYSSSTDIAVAQDSLLLPISGTIQFKDGRNGNQNTPAAGATVCVLDEDDNGLLEELSCTIADDDGNWSVEVNRFEEDDDSSQDLVFSFMTTNDSFEVLDKDRNYYTYMTDTLREFSGPEIFGLLITVPPSESQTNQAFWTFSTMYDGWKFFNDLGFDHQDDDSVKVLWELGTSSNYSPKISENIPDDKISTHYHPAEKEIRLDGRVLSSSPNQGGGGDANDPSTILHEYGHHIMNIAYTNSGGPNAYDPGSMGCFVATHRIEKIFADPDGNQIPECSWIEGWAHFVSLAVQKDSIYEITEQGITVDFETGKGTSRVGVLVWDDVFDDDEPVPGIDSTAIEGRIAAAMWDMYDGDINDVDDDDNDNFETDFANIWNVFNGMSTPPNEDRPADDFIEFWHDWIRENPDTTSQTQNILLLNKIGDEDHESINASPVAVDISVSVFADTPTEITLEAGDLDYDLLTFSIETFPRNGVLGDISQNDVSSSPIDSTVQSASVTYSPNANIESDSFSFKASDGIDPIIATVNITIEDGIMGETIVFSDEFTDLTHWDSSGDDDEKWEIVADDVNGGSNDKIVSGKNCDDFCYLKIKNNNISLTGFVDPTISFSRLVSDRMDEEDEGLYLQVFDDGSWVELGRWTENTGNADGIWHVQSPPISLDDYISPNLLIRFLAQSSNSPEMVQIDNVVIRANQDDDGGGGGGDDDDDGISNPLDTDVDAFSDDFSDVSIAGGSTSGSIIQRGGQDLAVVDATDENKGVSISTDIVDTDNTLSKISLCDENAILKMADGDSLVATCGSVILDGTKGKINVELNSDDGSNKTFTTRLDENDSLTFDPAIPSLTTTDTSGTLEIRIMDSDLVFDLLSGDTLSPPADSPTDVLANSTSYNQIDLSWTAPTNDGGAPITGYKIERESPPEEGFVIIEPNTNSTDTTFTDGGDKEDDDTGLAPDTQYNYQVSAINDIGTSSIASAVSSATTNSISSPPIDTIISTVAIPNPDPGIGDRFGWTVGGIGNSDKVVVGMHHDDPEGIRDAGSAIIFNANNVTQIMPPLENPDPDIWDNFGFAVAGVGNDKVVVGTRASDPDELSQTGSAFVFDANNGTMITPLENPNPGYEDWFGYTVAGIGDDKVVVGTTNDEPNSMRKAGAAYVFDANNGTMLFTLDNPRPDTNDNFGYAVGGIGNDKVVVGSVFDTSNVMNNTGAAFVFDANTGEPLMTLENPNPDYNDNFGYAVAGVGNDKVVISALLDKTSNSMKNYTGTVYVFDTATTTGGGDPLLTIPNPVPDVNDQFGYAVAGIGDSMMVVSAPYNGNNSSDTHNAGVAYVFDAVTGELLVTLDNPDHETSKEFGHSVAGIGDNKVIVGSYYGRDSDGIKVGDGTAYVFELGSGLGVSNSTTAAITSSSS